MLKIPIDTKFLQFWWLAHICREIVLPKFTHLFQKILRLKSKLRCAMLVSKVWPSVRGKVNIQVFKSPTFPSPRLVLMKLNFELGKRKNGSSLLPNLLFPFLLVHQIFTPWPSSISLLQGYTGIFTHICTGAKREDRIHIVIKQKTKYFEEEFYFKIFGPGRHLYIVQHNCVLQKKMKLSVGEELETFWPRSIASILKLIFP